MTLEEQFQSLGLMIAMGVWIGASFSVYQYFIHPGRKARWILLIIDPVFWILQALLLFVLLLPVNEGRLRVYLFLGTALGFSVYMTFLEKPFMRFFDRIVAWIVRIARFAVKTVCRLLLDPLYFLLKLAYRLCKIIISIFLKTLLFLLVMPLKVLRGFLRVILPEKWLIDIEKRLIGIQTKVMKWLAFISGRK